MLPADANRYHVHPAMLDGVIQLVGFIGTNVAGDISSEQSWVPAGIDRVEMHTSIGRGMERRGKDASVWAHARVIKASAKTRVLDFSIYFLGKKLINDGRWAPVRGLFFQV